MAKQVYFSEDLLKVMSNTMEIVDDFDITRATPLVIFKGILDLEVNPLYDFISNECYSDYEDICIFFENEFTTLSFIQEGEEIPEDEKCKYIDTSKDKELYYTEEVAVLLSRTIQIAYEDEKDGVEVEHLLNAITEKIPKDILNLLRNLSVNIQDFKRTFSKKEAVVQENKKNVLPYELKSFMKILNDKYQPGTRCPILGRDKECEVVWKTMQKKTKRNVILVGKPGVGKSSVAKKITYDIINGNCPEEFKDFLVISVDVNSTIAGTEYRGQAEERFKKMIDFLEKTDNVILFIDEVHTILGAGACRDGEMDLANALKPMLAEDKIRVIGATTSEEYEKYFSKDGALKRRFRKIEVKEPTSKQVYPMLKNAISDLSEYHGVKISKVIIEYIILISSCFNYETSNPDRTIDLVDLAMVTAKTEGKASVDKACVLKNFDIYLKKFEKMDYKVKKSTAYHEAGHYLAWRMSGNLKDLEGIAVSIMPAGDYLGVTVFDELDDEVTISGDMDYFIDSIAVDLAGRVAEKMYTNTLSSGASADIENATKYAYSIVAKYGMIEGFGANRVYFDSENYSMCSEKTVDNINTEIDKIIKKGYERAEEILSKNEVYLKKLVNQLMRKGILSKRDLDRIFEQKPKGAKVTVKK